MHFTHRTPDGLVNTHTRSVPGTTSAHRAGGDLATFTLGAAAALHLAWGFGATWPAESAPDLADLVVGVQPMPGTAPCVAVAAALASAAALINARTHPTAPLSRLPHGVVSTGTRATAAALGARGIIGLLSSTLGSHGTPQYRRWDRRLYSPLCLALALAIAGTPRPKRRAPVDRLSE